MLIKYTFKKKHFKFLNAILVKTSTIIVCHQIGRMGNCLYRMAHLIAFARDHGLKIYDLSFSRKGFSEHFAYSRNQPIIRYPDLIRLPFNASMLQSFVWKLYRYLQKYKILNFSIISGGTFDQCDLENLNSRIVEFEGVDFVYKAGIEKHCDFIRSHLRFNESINTETSHFIDSLRKKNQLVVGIHVRRGDFKEFDGGRHYFEWCDYAAYAKELKKLLANKKVGFVICTDSAKQYSKMHFGSLETQLSSFDSAGDMAVLSKCDYIISPGRSTFSGWSSFIGEVPLLCMSSANLDFKLSDFITIRSLIN